MLRTIIRVLATAISVVGVLLLARVLLMANTGALTDMLFPQSPASWIWTAWALALSLAVPFHVISIGLILQRRWLSDRWARVAWFSIVISGCWLGAAIAAKLFLLK
jgi:hypothetical protein